MQSDEVRWTFFSNHTHVLVYLAVQGDSPLREVAQAVGITERAAQSIVADLCAGGVVTRERVGRRNHYHINLQAPLRHPLENHVTIGEILAVLQPADKQQ